MSSVGVFPVHENKFKINPKGRTGLASDRVIIKDLETFEPSIDSKKEEWNPMDTKGWIRRAVTGKGLSFSFKGKRNYGDPGNDYVAGLLISTGQGVESEFEWVLPNGDSLVMNCVIDLKKPAGGNSTDIDALEFDLLSDGLPSYLPNLSFACVAGGSTGKTKVTTVTPTMISGNSYRYSTTGPLPTLGQSLTSWTAYTLGSDITAASGVTVYIAEVDSSNNCVKAGYSVSVPA